MRIEYEVKDIAPMSWLAHVKDGIAKVTHGVSVCCEDGYFVEGAWNGDFTKGQFVSSNWFCGTGAEVKNNRIIFSTPTHVTYGLFSAKLAGGVLRKQ